MSGKIENFCRCCWQEEEDDFLGPLLNLCDCSGTNAFIHKNCFISWLQTRGNSNCEVCKAKYRANFIKKPKSIFIWFKSCEDRNFLITILITSIIFMVGTYVPSYLTFKYIKKVPNCCTQNLCSNWSCYMPAIFFAILISSSFIYAFILVLQIIKRYKNWGKENFVINLTSIESNK